MMQYGLFCLLQGKCGEKAIIKLKMPLCFLLSGGYGVFFLMVFMLY